MFHVESGDPSDLTASLEFCVSREMLQLFSVLTGDRSSLHTDQAFAERSMYRSTVVHGMLPLIFLMALDPCRDQGARWSVSELAARFLKPAFVNDRLALSAKPMTNGEDTVKEVEYIVRSLESGAVLTTARAKFCARSVVGKGRSSRQPDRYPARSCLVTEALTEQDFQFDQISKGQRACLRFQASSESLALCHQILTDGLASTHKPPADEFHASLSPDVLAASLVSTLVGMCIPGKSGTLMDVRVKFAKPIQLHRLYRLTGIVEHKSPSTGTLVESIVIQDDHENGEVSASGKVSAKVNAPTMRGQPVQAIRRDELDLQLKDKVVVITGASRGIGETTAKLLSLHGAKVVVNYRKARAEAKRVVDEIVSAGGDAYAVQADVSDRGQVRDMISAACARYQTVHILINNAVADFYPLAFRELTWERLQKDLDVVVKGAFHCCQEVLPLMIRNGGGKIINVSSVATDNPPLNQTKYVVAKSALTGLTRSLAVELALHNIQVNLVAASMVETDLVKHVPKVFMAGIKNDTPMKRLATTADVAKAIVFLASSLSSFTTGQRILVTGGNPPFL